MKVPQASRTSRLFHRSSIMNVGRRVDYAVRALCYVAAQPPGRYVPRREIQLRQNIPAPFLSKILRDLVHAGLLLSVPGARGGFRLGKPAEAITLREVYESLEGPLNLIDCVTEQDDACCFASVCTQIQIWRGAQELLARYLEDITIQAIADRHGLVPRLQEKHQSAQH
jgi:Rrf2 family protein